MRDCVCVCVRGSVHARVCVCVCERVCVRVHESTDAVLRAPVRPRCSPSRAFWALGPASRRGQQGKRGSAPGTPSRRAPTPPFPGRANGLRGSRPRSVAGGGWGGSRGSRGEVGGRGGGSLCGRGGPGLGRAAGGGGRCPAGTPGRTAPKGGPARGPPGAGLGRASPARDLAADVTSGLAFPARVPVREVTRPGDAERPRPRPRPSPGRRSRGGRATRGGGGGSEFWRDRGWNPGARMRPFLWSERDGRQSGWVTGGCRGARDARSETGAASQGTVF